METFMNELLFICAIEDNTMILCEKHAKIFEIAACTAMTPHTIIEMEDEDRDGHICMACDLQDELTRPQIILPGEF
jgi:hypothetical protein